MERPKIWGVVAGICVIILVISVGCTTEQQQGTPQPTLSSVEDSYVTVLDPGVLETKLTSSPDDTLSTAEISDLRFLEEEERLARDVYGVFYEEWGMQVFKNIGGAEQTHMDSVTVLIERYGLDDEPSEIIVPGVFGHPELQILYDDLVSAGLQSPEDALRAAALVEETDIVDLQDAMSRTENADIRYVYENLMRGSENHLRAFVKNLEQLGASYSPAVLTQNEYDEIISTAVSPGGFS
ncbi:DUF2202 domain-containing protein [Methanogenium organophilum]|uniref:DUF2202 domain-containing protein n=1 Tax=Methanogenium organophilum TaxID=2199 RepID=A0A9X9T921_METOG|nr:DUF2202 domain-containing protein [Methanogenium organophilum]WAI01991.1 DUF2202 domain-containing protein [Methanogenium organophilum]